ncbi:MAG: POTRA domain-containing protein [Terracidiphilus sp.]|nr:POTRA domain-containing protein [Terracidiphilus sp.]
MRTGPAVESGIGGGARGRCGAWIFLLCTWLAIAQWPEHGRSQVPAQAEPESHAASSASGWMGRTVRKVEFEGVTRERLEPLAGRLAEAEGKPLTAIVLRQMLRQLYATGLYENVAAEARTSEDGMELVFRGRPRMFVGTVGVEGAKGASMNMQLAQASRLTAGTRFTEAGLAEAEEQMRSALAGSGFHEPAITHKLTPHPDEQLVDINFYVASGPQARVGAVEVTGDAGMSADEFRRHAHLRDGTKIDRDTGNKALTSVLHHYQKQERFEAEIKLVSQKYNPATHRSEFSFSANRGPVVRIDVAGASMSPDKLKRVIPVFEEGAVDEDLLNEGSRRLRDYYQRLGYFDAKATHEEQNDNGSQVTIVYHVDLGPRRRVDRVSVAGNKYFDAGTLKELLAVRASDSLDHHGAYSQALVSADVAALEGEYRNNGFAEVKVTPETSTPPARHGKIAPLEVTYRIEEGRQVRVGSVRIEGNAHYEAAQLTQQMNTTAGQLFSPQYLAGDRDALMAHYLSRGFAQASVTVTDEPEAGNAGLMDVVFHVTEGQQTFVRKVLLTGLHYTRPETVERAITLHPGDPLNETALNETQRNLYEFALFNEVDAAVQNPTGGETQKTVLLQTVEARRWALTYGGGFEAQTGTPQNNCGSAIVLGKSCDPNGKTGVSLRGILDITRNNLRGREQSASLRGTYGLLEQKIDLLYQIPHFQGNRDFGFTFSGGYANSKDVTTYVASRLQAGLRLTESFTTPGTWLSKANTLVGEYDFRRVKVAAESLQVSPYYITQLSTAVRVAGPSLTWVRDTRDSPLDARRGTYTSFQDFVSMNDLGAEVGFNRLDLQNSNYFSFGRDRFVLARNTRYGQERAFRSPTTMLLPLPERLYAGGATSMRGYPQNGAGPRDPQTGYPIGGAGALINSTELRLPPATLPWLGNSLSFVLFHDMGNVFTNAGDAWISVLRAHQTQKSACRASLSGTHDPTKAPSGPISSTGAEGSCNYNYFSHTPGLGMRYHTPAGPIRLDFGYNLNPPIYPVIYDYTLSKPGSNPHMDHGNHFNFFFSLGQSF